MKLFIRRISLKSVVLGILFLSGCSVTFMYKRLDWFLPWYMEDYISFNEEQQALVNERIGALIQWHRRDQLPVYANFFGCIAARAEDGLTATEVDAIEKAMRIHLNVLLTEISVSLAGLAQVLSDDQVDELFDNIGERNEQFRSRWIDAEETAQRRLRAERMEKMASRWMQELNDAQLARIAQWSNSLHLQGQAMLDARQDWQRRLREVMQARRDSIQTQKRLQALLLNRAKPADSRELARYEQNKALLRELIVDLDQSLTSFQRRHFVNRLRDFEEDFIELTDTPQRVNTMDCAVIDNY